MKLRPTIAGLAAWVFAVMLGAPATSPAEDLYNANITAKINLQGTKTERVNCHKVGGQKICDEVQVNTIQSFTINNRTLMNLLLGQSPLSNPPPNLTFGVSFGCDDDDNAQLVIFDRGTSNMVAVADISDTDLIYSGKVFCSGNGPCEVVNTSFEGFLKLTFRTLGSPGTNSIDGGEIRLYAKGSLNAQGCIIKAGGSGTGKINVTSDGEEIEVFVSSFTLTSGKKLMTLPAPPLTSSGSADMISIGSSLGLHGFIDTSISVQK